MAAIRHTFALVLTCLLGLVPVFSATAQESRPNIVFLLADDLGYGDIGCYGCPDIRTPNVDMLARQGVRFTQFYANGPECTPTRTAFMTGRYQQRVGGLECAIGTNNVGRYDDAIRLAKAHDLGLPPSYAVIPGDLKQAGYAAGIFGKWHLGYEPKFNPTKYGWDEFLGILGGNCDYFMHQEVTGLPVLYANDKQVKRKGYATHLFTDAAVDFLKRKKDKPFFLYLPFTTPHSPFQGPGDFTGKLTTEKDWNQGTRKKYVEMVEDMDRQIGRVLKTLDQLKLTRNTIVIFASDNGGAQKARNLPYSGFKGGLFEGGIREPLVVRWPGKFKPGTVSKQPCLMMDLTASILRIAGAKTTKPLDGVDIFRHVEEKKADVKRNLFWRARRGERTWRAVRAGDMKYIKRVDGDKQEEWLFDLTKDPAEKQNLLAKQPGDAKRLKILLSKWEKEVRHQR